MPTLREPSRNVRDTGLRRSVPTISTLTARGYLYSRGILTLFVQPFRYTQPLLGRLTGNVCDDV